MKNVNRTLLFMALMLGALFSVASYDKVTGGGGAAQTPIAQDVNYAGFALTNAGNITTTNLTVNKLTTLRAGYQLQVDEINADGFTITSNHCVLIVDGFVPTVPVSFPVANVTNGFRLEFYAKNNANITLTNTIGDVYLGDSSTARFYTIDEGSEARGAVFTKYGTNWFIQQ